MEKSTTPESLSTNCPAKTDEIEIIVTMRNPQTPEKEIAEDLGKLCTVLKGPTKALNTFGFWTGNWSLLVRLGKDDSSFDGLWHLPDRCTLGNSDAIIYYLDDLSNEENADHKKDYEPFCDSCLREGHDFVDCPDIPEDLGRRSKAKKLRKKKHNRKNKKFLAGGDDRRTGGN